MNSQSILSHFISFLPHSHQYYHFIIYLIYNYYPILPQFFPNSHSNIFHSQSISYLVFIPLFLNSFLFHYFSLHSYSILSHFMCSPDACAFRVSMCSYLTWLKENSRPQTVLTGWLCSQGKNVFLFGMIKNNSAWILGILKKIRSSYLA